MRNALLASFMLVAFFPTNSADKKSCSNEPLKSAAIKLMAQPLKKVGPVYRQRTYDTFTGYLNKRGQNQDGSSKFVISYTTLTTSGCPED